MRRAAAVVGLVALVTILGYGAYFVLHGIPKIHLPVPGVQACVVGADAETSVSLSPDQMANAATISAVGIRRGLPRKAIVVALATAWQESKLINLSGGDRDSLGLFQPRPSEDWGSRQQISDPRYAASAFYDELLKVKGWQQMRLTDAAQAVQRSAYPEAYEKWAANAEVLTQALNGEVPGAVGCTVESVPDTHGPEAVEALLSGLKLDWGTVRGTAQATGVSLTVRDDRSGWQYAHWLVAHATERGVRRVSFGASVWTAKAGTWSKPSSQPSAGAGNTVFAEVQG
jgi:hypothetical protein